jgi:spore germination cell wall hydrolase CwlJ-like protein
MKALLIALLLSPITALASQSEFLCKAYTVYREASGEPLVGKRSVLDVIENRMRIRKKTACQVMSEKSQFSFYKPGMKMQIPEKFLTEFLKVITMRRVLPTDVEHFHTRGMKPPWSSRMRKVAVIGNHIFLTNYYTYTYNNLQASLQ